MNTSLLASGDFNADVPPDSLVEEPTTISSRESLLHGAFVFWVLLPLIRLLEAFPTLDTLYSHA
jgi:hypothetical protein